MPVTFPPGAPRAVIDAPSPNRGGCCLGERTVPAGQPAPATQPDIGATLAAALGHALTLGLLAGTRPQPEAPRRRMQCERDARFVNGPCR